MVRRSTSTPPDVELDEDATPTPEVRGRASADRAVGDLPDLSDLPIIGLTRRRLAGIVGTLLAVWIVVVFARQVGDASAATARVDQMTADNTARSIEVSALTRELE